MNTARVSRTLGSLHEAGAVTSPRRLPVAGKIRPGVKVLTQAAAKVAGAQKVYNDGLAAGASFDDIAAQLSRVSGIPKYPLTPRNAAYFSVRQCDFATPGAAEAIMQAYATVRPGDPEPRLYAFPIIFPSDDIDLVFRENFEAYKAGKLHRWSEQSPNGPLNCLRRIEEITPGAGRRWGGRPTEIDRPCNPNDCDLFAKGECKHVASLSFWMPGVKGAGVIELTFTSIYASLGIAETLEMVRAGLGRISGLHNGAPIFWLSKVRKSVSRINWETGKPEKTDQWIIQMEAGGLDMVAVLAGTAPLAQLPAPEPAPASIPANEPIAATEPTNLTEVAELRKQMAAMFQTLDWDQAMAEDWLARNYENPQQATRDIELLSDIVERLSAVAEKQKQAASMSAEDIPTAPKTDTEEAPF